MAFSDTEKFIIAVSIILFLFTFVLIVIITEAYYIFVVLFMMGIIALIFFTPSVMSPIMAHKTKGEKLANSYRAPKPITPLLDQEPKSVVEIWVISIIVTLVFFFIDPILGALSGVIAGIILLAVIDNNNKLLRKQIIQSKLSEL